MQFKSMFSLFALILLLGSSDAAQGGVIISFSNATVVAGGLGSLDIDVSSDADPSTPDNLDLFSLHLLLTPENALGSLAFTNPQSESHLAPGILNNRYLLRGDSIGEANFGLSPISTVSGTNYADDTLDFLDATMSFQGVNLSSASGLKLLFHVEFDATQAQIGDTFFIALINDGNNQTLFSDSSSNILSLADRSFDPFRVTAVAPITVVPEPSAMAVFLALSLVTVWRRRIRNSRNASETI